MKSLALLSLLGLAACDNQLLYVLDIVNVGSYTPVHYMNATGVSNAAAGPGQLTPFGMRQLNMRGREMRRRYITNQQYLSAVSNPVEYYAYAIDNDRTYQSALSYMTGFYPGGTQGPPQLYQNQTVVAVPPITVDQFAQINATLNMNALQSNFQTVPIHSDEGNFNSTVFQGYDAGMCPIIGEIQMYELSNKTNPINATFAAHKQYLTTLFQQKGMPIPPNMVLDDLRTIIQEIWTNTLEQMYVPSGLQFTADQQAHMA